MSFIQKIKNKMRKHVKVNKTYDVDITDIKNPQNKVRCMLCGELGASKQYKKFHFHKKCKRTYKERVLASKLKKGSR